MTESREPQPQTRSFRKPPEGVIAGEDVPPENDRHDHDVAMVREYAAQLKAHPIYGELSEDARMELARKHLEKQNKIQL